KQPNPFSYPGGGTVILKDPPPQDGTLTVTTVPPATVFLPTPPPPLSPDFIEALLTAVGVGLRSLPGSLADTAGPVSFMFERSGQYAPAIPPSAGAGSWMFRSEHVGGGLDDSDSADSDLPPTAAEIDAVFSRFAQELFQ